MHLLDKREREMDKEEKIKLELMRTLIVCKGYNLRDAGVDFDFRTGSNAEKTATMLLKRFDISFKNEKEAGIHWSEKEVSLPKQRDVPVETEEEPEVEEPKADEDTTDIDPTDGVEERKARKSKKTG